MNKLIATLIGASVFTAALPALAATTADLAVTGTIIPQSCDVALSGGGSINLGTISAASLNAGTATPLPVDTSVNVTVTCTAPVRFALETSDQRAASSTLPGAYGLGQTSTSENIGHYTLTFTAATDTTAGPLKQTISTNNGTSWASPGTAEVIPVGSYVGFVGTSAGTADAPVALDAVTATVQMAATIAPTDGLTLTADQTIDGLATLEVRYL